MSSIKKILIGTEVYDLPSGEGHIYTESLDSLAEGILSNKGVLNTASGKRSHAEGDGTDASGSAAHAEGTQTIAAGNSSHAEGVKSGYTDYFSGIAMIIETGPWTISDTSYRYRSTEDNGDTMKDSATGFIIDLDNGGAKVATVTASKFNGSWDYFNINSSEQAALEAAIAANHFMAFTYGAAVTVGTGATNLGSHSEGIGTSSQGIGAHAEGLGTSAQHAGGHAEGINTTAVSNGSHAEGYYSTASGGGHAEGEYTISSRGHSEGSRTKAGAIASHAEGEYTFATGRGSHAQGSHGYPGYCPGMEDYPGWNGGDVPDGTIGVGRCARIRATGAAAHAQGYLSSAATRDVLASGICSYSRGFCTQATGAYSVAEGDTTTASGNYSRAIGRGSSISNTGASAIGQYLLAGKDWQTVIGQYNVQDSAAFFVIGAGNSTTRKNVFTVDSSAANVDSIKAMTEANRSASKFFATDGTIQDIPTTVSTVTFELASTGSEGAADAQSYYNVIVENEEVTAEAVNEIAESVGLTQELQVDWEDKYPEGTTIVEAIKQIEIPTAVTIAQAETGSEGVADAQSYYNTIIEDERVTAQTFSDISDSVGLNNQFGVDWDGKYPEGTSIVNAIKSIEITTVTTAQAESGTIGAADALSFYNAIVEDERVTAQTFSTVSDSVGLNSQFEINWNGLFTDGTSIVSAINQLDQKIGNTIQLIDAL